MLFTPMAESSLAGLRREIDRIDDSIHDLLIQRTAVVNRLAGARVKGQGPAMRPGREAEILRRLARRHDGDFPRAVLIRIWREIFGATTRLQGDFRIGVFMPERQAGFARLARDQFGSFTDVVAHSTCGGVLRAVRDGNAELGILPLPLEDDPEPWWPALVSEGARAVRVVVRLPFGATLNDEAGRLEALGVAKLGLEETGEDHSYLAVEAANEISRGRIVSAFRQAGLTPFFVAGWGEGWADPRQLHLIGVEGFVAEGDARIAGVREALGDAIERIVPLGGYAVPLGEADLQPRGGNAERSKAERSKAERSKAERSKG